MKVILMEAKTVHFIGIGGISMSGIAEMLLSFGYQVTGTDIKETNLTQKLTGKGAHILYGHHPEMIKDADMVVYTAAVKEDDPERIMTQKLNKPTLERAEFLGQISQNYENCLCISGTHGKSTTTGMVSSIFLEANLNPTIQIGATMNKIKGNSYIGSTKYLIMEACEYVDSFLHFHPTSEIILNIDDDHLDYFKNIANVKNSFTKYINLLPDDGLAVLNVDDANINDIIPNITKPYLTYGIKNEAAYTAQNISQDKHGFYQFDIYHQGNLLTHIELKINGYHNIYNALAAFVLAQHYIKDMAIIKKGLETYTGVDRRFQFLGEYNGAAIYDDYAHHPTEIASTLASAKTIFHHQTWAVFQSHTFSRTQAHMQEFADILAQFDNIVIAPIYPAREINTFGVSAEQLVDKIKQQNPHVVYKADFAQIVDYLKNNVQPDDLVITIGAGPINEVAYQLVTK